MLTQDQFNESQQRITSAWHSGNFQDAFAEIDRVLKEGTDEMKGTALFYRAMIHESRRDWEQVREDSRSGLKYAAPSTFLRYQLEHAIGAAYNKQAFSEKANQWFTKALQTCAEGDDFSGHKTLAALMKLANEESLQMDQALMATVAAKSWRVLEVPGEPDLADIRGTVHKLCEQFSKTVEEISGSN